MSMSKILFLFLCFFVVFAQAREANTEFRSLWVITWEHINAQNTAQENMATVRRILDNMQKANMNAVLWQVRQGGTSYYRSGYEPWGPYAGYRDPGYDPLAYAVQEAHKRGMEIHAWINCFQTAEMVDGAPARQHPEWVCRNREDQPMTSSRALSPGLKQVRDYTVNVAMDIVRRYDVDGLHLDYVRWNEETGPTGLLKAEPERPALDGQITDEEMLALTTSSASRYLYDVEHPYNAGIPSGFGSWEDWWRWSVTEFVRTLHDSIQATKPWVRLSAAVLGRYNWGVWNGYNDVYQDAALWFNTGYVDQLMPMHYHWSSGAEFLGMLVNNGPECWSPYIQEGIKDGRLYSTGPGSYKLSEDKLMDRHPGIVTACRQVPWVDGFQFFSYGTWRSHDYFDVANSTFFPTKTKIRAAAFLHDGVPTNPSMQLLKLDSLHYRISIQPALDASQDHWRLIYRAPVTTALSYPEIIHINFGHEPFEFVDAFTGLQDYNGRYVYYATVCDRYWNESLSTPEQHSDSIPSFAPTVLRTNPAPGDTIDAKAEIVITFSKTMNPTDSPQAISFQPAVEIGSVRWSTDNKSCTISPLSGFSYGQSYSLEIFPSLQDVNGRVLDGNGDGNSGDKFTTSFYVKSPGPQVLALYPQDQALIMPEEVLTLVFDSPLAAASLTETNLSLLKGEQGVPYAWSMVGMKGKTILSVQPKSVLDLDSDYELSLTAGVTDTLGHALQSPLLSRFRTADHRVGEARYIDQFVGLGNWKAPTYSGSTVGVRGAACLFELAKEAYLPNNPLRWRNSAGLSYEWDPAASTFLLREYMDVAVAGTIKFDSTYTLQCFVFGDASGTQLRFALDDATQHEVSLWITVDWYGWRLLEWKLSDANSFGTWLGNGVFNSSQLNFDSIQLTRGDSSAWSGKMYFDELRVVKKTRIPTLIAETPVLVDEFQLSQNYPNPFNAETKFRFSLPHQEKIKLIIYDVLGREVAMPVAGTFSAGVHEIKWSSRGLPSGVYFYVLRTPTQRLQRKLTLTQ